MSTTRPTDCIELLRERLIQQLAPAELFIRDDSALHAGHAGAREGGHYHVRLCSARFQGLSPIARHRLVYAAAGDLLGSRIHALSIEADLPA